MFGGALAMLVWRRTGCQVCPRRLKPRCLRCDPGATPRPLPPAAPPAAANCLKKRVCDEPSGPYPTFVTTKACTAAGKCTPKSVPVVQAYYASK